MPASGLAAVDVNGVHLEEFPGALTVFWPWLDAVWSLGLLLLADLVH
jgi:hypothetical protein